MNIKNLLKNKFIVAIFLALPICVCFNKFNNYRKLNSQSNNENENENNNNNQNETQQEKILGYLKLLLLSYVISLLIVFIVSKGQSYLSEYKLKVSNKLKGGNSNESSSSKLDSSVSTNENTHSSKESISSSSSKESENLSSVLKGSGSNDTSASASASANSTTNNLNTLNSDKEKLISEQKALVEKVRLFKLKQQNLKNNNENNINSRSEDYFNTGQPDF